MSLSYRERQLQGKLFDMDGLVAPRHPATYSVEILDMLNKLLPKNKLILDMFGGIGGLKKIRPDAVCMDIEYEWALESGLQANALRLPFDTAFDCVCTSPTYGNRMADSYISDDTTNRSYTNFLRRELHNENSGGMQWGENYRKFHKQAWKECYRVLLPGGLFFTNIKDHYRDKKLIKVSEWHNQVILEIGFQLEKIVEISVSGYGLGENGQSRTDNELIYIYRCP